MGVPGRYFQTSLYVPNSEERLDQISDVEREKLLDKLIEGGIAGR